MPLGVSVKVDTAGITEVLKESQTRKATLKAVRAGIKLVNAAVKPTAPTRSRALKQAQGTKAVKGRKGKTGSFAVQGARTKFQKTWKGRVVRPAFYDHLVIGGVKPHGVGPGGAVKDKPHPGHKPNPYRAGAYNSVAARVNSEVLRVMGAETNAMLAKASAKIKK